MEPTHFPAYLLQKFLDGTITDAESLTLSAWLKENPDTEDPALEALLEQVYQRAFAETPALQPGATQRILDRLMESTAVPVRPLRRPWLRYAAAAALLLAVAGTAMLVVHQKKAPPLAGNTIIPPRPDKHTILTLGNGQRIQLDSVKGNIAQNGTQQVNNDAGMLDYKGNAGSMEYHTLTTPKGEQYRLILADGTEVWLNAGSSITYPTAFNGGSRQVKMSGEAYFEIKQAANAPFTVDIDNRASVEVLGTAFNVNAYTNEPDIRTTLLHGRVRMKLQNNSAVLHPGQQAVIHNDQLQVNANADTAMAVVWKEGLFRFDRTPLDAVLRQLARWYDVDIIYEEAVPHILFSGEIKRDLDLGQALTVLSNMGVHYRIDGRKLIIMP